jgi:hypothetical protein
MSHFPSCFSANTRPTRFVRVLLATGAVLMLAGLPLTGCAGTGARTPAPTSTPSTSGKVVAVEPLRIAPDDSGKLTLEAAIAQLSEALLKAPPGTAWKPQAEHAREIQQNRPELAALVEDADWVLTLSGELSGPRPAGQKAGLRRLHERYAAHAPHTEIAAQVNALLADIQDEHLRRELKKLANRSWERERRTPVAPVLEKKIAAPSLPSPVGASEPDSIVTPERYCAERRAQAARSYADARAATEPSLRKRYLARSLEYLDDCLNTHPDTPEAEKARQNRARVQQELTP